MRVLFADYVVRVSLCVSHLALSLDDLRDTLEEMYPKFEGVNSCVFMPLMATVTARAGSGPWKAGASCRGQRLIGTPTTGSGVNAATTHPGEQPFLRPLPGGRRGQRFLADVTPAHMERQGASSSLVHPP